MTVTVFTSNQSRHVSLIQRLAQVADSVFAVQECSTLFPGQVADFFAKSAVMQDYFSRVLAAEARVFGGPAFLPDNVRSLSMKMGDLSRVPIHALRDALAADVFIVFGASFIKPPLVDALVDRRAVNIHMGVSPWYRGSSTNFWAMYDRRPAFVGATIHRLSRGLDSGDVLFHAFPSPAPVDAFDYGMLAVRAAHDAVVSQLQHGDLLDLVAIPQDRSLELRYTRNADFTDAAAADYLARLPSPRELFDQLSAGDRAAFHRPFIAKSIAAAAGRAPAVS